MEEQCGVTVGSQGEQIRGCLCPQYWMGDQVGNYVGQWMAGSPTFFQARFISALGVIRFAITYAMAEAYGYLDARGQLIDTNVDTGDAWWGLSSFFWPTAPSWFRKMFSYQEASGGLTFVNNTFCVGLHFGSVLYIATMYVFPLYIFFTYYWDPVLRIILDITSAVVFVLDVWFNFLTLQAIKYGGATLEEWQIERSVQAKDWAQKAWDRVPRRPKFKSATEYFFGVPDPPLKPMDPGEIYEANKWRLRNGLPELSTPEIDAENEKRFQALKEEDQRRREERVKKGPRPENQPLGELTEAEIKDINYRRTMEGKFDLTLGEIRAENLQRRRALNKEHKRRMQRGFFENTKRGFINRVPQTLLRVGRRVTTKKKEEEITSPLQRDFEDWQLGDKSPAQSDV